MTTRAAVAATLVAVLIASPMARAQEPAPPEPPEAVGFDTVSGFDGHGILHTATIPYAGPEKRPLLGADFYRAVGREDLAQSYESRDKVRTGLIAGGAAVLVGSIVASFVAGGGQECEPTGFTFPGSQQQICTPSKGPNAGIAVGGSLAGFALGIAGLAVRPDPVDDAQKHELADEHNQKLRPHASIVPEGEGLGLKIAF
jgi:hypothetical protein